MATRSKERRLYVSTASTFGEDSDVDGSAAVPIFTTDVGFADSGKSVIETNYFTGRSSNTPSIRGPSGGQLTFSTPLIGFANAVGDGASPPSADWLDILLNNAFGSGTAIVGEGVGVGSTVADLVLDTEPYTAQDVIAVWETGINSNRAQIRRLGSATNPHTLNRNWTTEPSTAGVCYGSRVWRGPVSHTNNYVTIALDVDGQVYALLGCRVTGLQLEVPAGGMAKLNWTIQADSWANATATKTALSVLDAFTGSPIIGQLASVCWGSTEYACSSVSIDFNLQSQVLNSVAGVNGRSGIEIMRCDPTVTIVPAFASGWNTDFEAGTNRNLEIKFGAGNASGGTLNMCAFFAEAAEIAQAPAMQDDGGYLRQSVQFSVRDPGVWSGSTLAHLFQFSRF